jgi:hypothetical protein
MTLPISESDQPIQAGPAIPAIEDDGTPVAGAAVPVVIVSDVATRGQASGEPLRVSFVTDRAVVAGSALPIVLVGNPPVLREQFATDANPLISTDTLHVLDTRDVLLTEEGAIRDQEPGTIGVLTTYAYGDEGVYLTQADGSGWARQAGRVVAFLFWPQDRNAWLTIGVSPVASNGDKRTNSLVLSHEDGKLVIGNGTQRIEIDSGKSNIRPIQYWLFVVAHPAYTELWLATIDDDTGGGMTDPVGLLGLPDARRVYVDFTNVSTPLYPVYQLANTLAYPLGSALDTVLIQDLPDATLQQDGGESVFFDRVNRANNTNPGAQYTVTGYWDIVSNAIVVQSAGIISTEAQADGYFIWEFDFPSGIPYCAPVVRMVDSQNYLRLYTNNANTYQLQVIQAGGFAGVVAGISGPVTWVQNGRNRVGCYLQGNRMLWLINGVQVTNGWVTDSANWFLTGTRMGFQDLNGAGLQARVKILACYDHAVTLPADLQRYATLRRGTRGAQIYQDTFTDANGTTLASRGWTVHTGTATIQNNAALLTGADEAMATIDAGTATFEAVATIQLPPDSILFTFIGLVIRKDANNYAYYRCAIDKVAQPNADEIERGRNLAGQNHITGKTQMDGLQYTAGATRVLSVRVWADGWVHVYLDGGIRLADRLPVALRGASRIGLYRYFEDRDVSGNPSTVLDFTVYALT